MEFPAPPTAACPASNSSNSPNRRCTRPHRQNSRPVPFPPSDDTKRRIVPDRQQSRSTPRFPPQLQTLQHGRLSRRSARRDQRHTGSQTIECFTNYPNTRSLEQLSPSYFPKSSIYGFPYSSPARGITSGICLPWTVGSSSCRSIVICLEGGGFVRR